MEGKGKWKDGKGKKGRGGKDHGAKAGGKPKDGGKPGYGSGKPGTYRTRDDNPNDTRPICPDFLKDAGCIKGGQCTMRHP
eukprot:1146991-Amphidinium_carterae.4